MRDKSLNSRSSKSSESEESTMKTDSDFNATITQNETEEDDKLSKFQSMKRELE